MSCCRVDAAAAPWPTVLAALGAALAQQGAAALFAAGAPDTVRRPAMRRPSGQARGGDDNDDDD